MCGERATISIPSGARVFVSDGRTVHLPSIAIKGLTRDARVDGAFEPWLLRLSDALLQLLPIPPGTQLLAAGSLTPPRVSIIDIDEDVLQNTSNSADADPRYHSATVLCNQRMTADGWYQDVRHLEFQFEDDIQYVTFFPANLHLFNVAMQVQSGRCCCDQSCGRLR